MSAYSGNIHPYAIDSFFGQSPYDVKIDSSEELSSLMEKAQGAQSLPFEAKLKVVQELAVSAMENAWEGKTTGKRQELSRSMVESSHSLSEALKERLGCCRYQATLFLILGAEAKLGTKHYLQSVSLGRMNTCYNDVYDEQGTIHHVSIFALSLANPDNNYTRDATVFERPNRSMQGHTFLGYTVDKEARCTLYSRPDVHLEGDPAKSKQAQDKIAEIQQLIELLKGMPETEQTKRLLLQANRGIAVHSSSIRSYTSSMSNSN